MGQFEHRNHTAQSQPADRVRSNRALARLVVRCCWLYAAGVVCLWLLLRTAADRWWPATLVLYGPRWVWALPLTVLFVGPVMGLNVPFQALMAPDAAGPGLRILTCNTEGTFVDAEALRALIATTRPQIVALQEWSYHQESELFGDDGWHVRTDNQLCLGSRYPIRDAQVLSSKERGGTVCGVRYDLQTPGGVLSFFNFHLASPREGLEEVLADPFRGPAELRANTALRWRESEVASRWVAEVAGPVLLAGDLNLPDDSAIFRHHWSPFADAFSSAGLGWGYTKFTHWHGVRIDHMLAGPGWQFRRCRVGPDVKSDHRPLIAEVEWVGAPD
jgi:endonuclease/exonuclease/phosphatase (EEP) superfamily protein YafD